jgi:squalene cyclase
VPIGDEKGAAVRALAPVDLAGPPAHQRVECARAASRRVDDIGEANLPRRAAGFLVSEEQADGCWLQLAGDMPEH